MILCGILEQEVKTNVRSGLILLTPTDKQSLGMGVRVISDVKVPLYLLPQEPACPQRPPLRSKYVFVSIATCLMFVADPCYITFSLSHHLYFL